MLRNRLTLVVVGGLLGLGTAVLLAALVAKHDGRELPEYVFEGLSGGSYFQPDPDLGYGPSPDVTVRSFRRNDGEPIYDVRYTIDPQGLRVTPGGRAGGRAVVFFGGSFTFGEGVEDDQTMPASVAKWLRGRTRVVNAGFHGYGPHQMLRALETRRLDPLLDEGVEHVVYQALDGHVMRAAGRTTWDLAGPAYELRDGMATYVGPFRSFLPVTVAKIANRFGPTRDLLQWWLSADEGDAAEDRERYVEIVVRAAEIVRERWGAGFSVVYWDHAGDPLPDLLRARGLDVLLVTEAFEGKLWRRFVLDVDRHPSRRGHAFIGRAVARRIQELRRTSARASPSSPGSHVVASDEVGGAGGR